MENMEIDSNFWKNKKVFLTGHTGFKGSWMSMWLQSMGAKLCGYSLPPPTNPSLFSLAKLARNMESITGDIRDLEKLKAAMSSFQPEIVFHMAAQPLVRASYLDPVETYSTNLMGTVHFLEAIRHTPSVRVAVNITSDKCYENKEWHWGYRENEPMGGYDPYSNSKGCSELITSAYRQSYFQKSSSISRAVHLASARAGNVIGGGDWAQDRLIPDILRKMEKNETIEIRNPRAIRPWQHVLEPLSGYLKLAETLSLKGNAFAEAWNFGPQQDDAREVEWIVKQMIQDFSYQPGYKIISQEQNLHEAHYLKLDCSKAYDRLHWSPRWKLSTTLRKISEWHSHYLKSPDSVEEISKKQIFEYMESPTLLEN